MKLSETRQLLAEELSRFEPDKPLAQAATPPASWYVDPRFLQLEKETVFKNHWQFVGRRDQLQRPGDFFCGRFLGLPYLVVLDEGSEPRAFYNVCSHRGTCVADGNGHTRELVCPYHGWTYALDGRLRKAPRAGAIPRLAEGNLDLKPLPVATLGPFVLIYLGSTTAPVEESLRELANEIPDLGLDPMRFITRKSYSLNCNWKVFVDNYLDGGYHLAMMHPDLAGLLDLKTYASRIGKGCVLQSCLSNTKVASQEESDRIGNRVIYLWQYPNFMINRYGPWMDTNWVVPLDVDRCRVIFDFYHDGEPDSTSLGANLNDSERVQREDTVICNRVQAGLQSGVYDQGIYAPAFERPMYYFHQRLFADLSGIDCDS